MDSDSDDPFPTVIERGKRRAPPQNTALRKPASKPSAAEKPRRKQKEKPQHSQRQRPQQSQPSQRPRSRSPRWSRSRSASKAALKSPPSPAVYRFPVQLKLLLDKQTPAQAEWAAAYRFTVKCVTKQKFLEWHDEVDGKAREFGLQKGLRLELSSIQAIPKHSTLATSRLNWSALEHTRSGVSWNIR